MAGKRQKSRAKRLKAQHQKTKSDKKNRRNKEDEEEDNEYEPSNKPSFDESLVVDDDEDDSLADGELGNGMDTESGEPRLVGAVPPGEQQLAGVVPAVDHAGTNRMMNQEDMRLALDNYAAARASQRRVGASDVDNGNNHPGVLAGPATATAPLITNDTPIEALWDMAVGRHAETTEITLDWVPTVKDKVTPEFVRNELLILGTKDPLDEAIGKHIETIRRMREAIVELTKAKMKSIVVAEAQKEGVMYGSKLVSKFEEVGKWWASLNEEAARENASKMFRIQQLPFEEDSWSNNLESEVLKVGNLVYHRQPNTPKNAKGCIERLITQIKVNQIKRLTDKGKQSHGFYVTVKAPVGMVLSRNERRKPGQWRDWMFQKAKAALGRSRNTHQALAALDRSRPHHVGVQFARFARLSQNGNENAATAAPASETPAAAEEVELGAGPPSAAETALQQALARMANMQALLEETNSANLNMRQELAKLNRQGRQDNLGSLKSGQASSAPRSSQVPKPKKTTTGVVPAARGEKGKRAPKASAVKNKTGKKGNNSKGVAANKGGGTAAAASKDTLVDAEDDIAAKVSFDSAGDGTTVTELTLPVVGGDESSEGDEFSLSSRSSEEKNPEIYQIKGGFLDRESGLCMVKLFYMEDKKHPVTVDVASAVYDDDHRMILHWVMEHRKSPPVWREQVEKKVEEMKEEGVDYDDWVGWEVYVREKVAAKILPPSCLSILEDSGGKPTAMEQVKHPHCVSEVRVSPLKEKRAGCTVHNFKSEGQKSWAVRGSGYALDGIVCAGVGGKECGKEFVSEMNEASSPGNAWLVRENTPAWWCNECKHTLCDTCHGVWCVANSSKRSRRGG